MPGLKNNSQLTLMRRAKADFIIETVCNHYEMSLITLKSKSRERHIVDARKMVCYFLREYTAVTYTAIGKLFGQDHTTILSAIRQINALLLFDQKIQTDYREIKLLF